MRVLLTGRPRDRNRLRPELLEAGIEIVGESDAAPGAASAPQSADAIVTAIAGDAGRFFRAAEPDIESLTAREQEVLALLAEGLPNKAIAHALGISDQTVKFHVAAIIGKLGAANRTDAVRRAVRRGLVAL